MTEPTREQIERFREPFAHIEWADSFIFALTTLALEALDGRNNRRLGAAVRPHLPVHVQRKESTESLCDEMADYYETYGQPRQSALYRAIATALRSETP